MTTPNEKIISKLRKILALARQGVGGEKTNAEAMLAKLMAKHGVTLDDLDDSAPVSRWDFPYRSDIEKRLLYQIICATLNQPSTATYRRPGKRALRVDMTKAQKMEVDLAFSIYKKALKKEIERCWKAFIYANNIFPTDNSHQDQDPTSNLDLAELIAITHMAAGMKPTTIHAAIENKGTQS